MHIPILMISFYTYTLSDLAIYSTLDLYVKYT